MQWNTNKLDSPSILSPWSNLIVIKPCILASASTRQRSSCCRCKWLSSLHSCQRGQTGTETQKSKLRPIASENKHRNWLKFVDKEGKTSPAGSQSACPSPCTGWRRQKASFRRTGCTPAESNNWNVSTFFTEIKTCLMSQSQETSCSQGMDSPYWYWYRWPINLGQFAGN